MNALEGEKNQDKMTANKRNAPKKTPTAKIKKENDPKRKKDSNDSDSIKDLFDEILAEYIEQGNDVPEGHNEKFEKYQQDLGWRMCRLPHHLLPKFNISKEANIKNVRSDLLLGVSLPHSAFVSSKYFNDIDICHRRTLALDNHIQRLKNMQHVYLTSLKKNKKSRKDEKAGVYSGAIIEYARRKDANPDKYFFGYYDFYYTGGNLCTQPETNRVLHANGNNMERLTFSMFEVEDNVPTIKPVCSVPLSEEPHKNQEIFEVQFSSFNCDLFFVRRRSCISIHRYTKEKFHSAQTFRSKDVPFISFSQNKENADHLAISSLDHQVRIYDLKQNTTLKSFKLLTSEEIKPFSNWNTIKSWDRSVYLYASNKKINVIDIRAPESEWRSKYCIYEDDSGCSNFCNLAVSNFENMFYVGSSHKLYLVDMRYLKTNIEDKNTSVLRWTHQMGCWPLLMATNRHADYEYVTLQSPVSSDLIICENINFVAKTPETDDSKDEISVPLNYQYKSPCMPYMPPSLESVFQEARRNGKGIKPCTGMENRVRSCITGLSFAGESSNPYILTATSHGDVFARHLYDRDSKTDRHTAAEVIGRFEENIFNSVRKVPLQITQVCDLPAINKVFRCSALSDCKLGEDELVASKRRFLGRWQKSLQTLHSYKDALVPDLLSIWDIEEESDKGVNLKGLEKTQRTDTNSLISDWLNSAQDYTHNTSALGTSCLSEGIIDCNVDFQSTMRDATSVNCSLLNNDSLVNISAISNKVDTEPMERTINTTSKSRATKKKSRYTKGF